MRKLYFRLALLVDLAAWLLTETAKEWLDERQRRQVERRR